MNDNTPQPPAVEFDLPAEKTGWQPWQRWLAAALLALVLLAINSVVWLAGVVFGGLGVPMPDPEIYAARWWLTLVCPLVLAAGALMPPLLIVRKASWRRVLLGMGVGFTTSLGVYLLWVAYIFISGL